TSSSSVGTYPITVNGAADSDYSISQVGGTLTIGRATLTVTGNNATRIYGIANPTFTSTYSGFVNGDTASVVSGNPTLTSPATASSPPGTYDMNVDVSGLTATNYSFSPVKGTLTVTPAPLSASAVNFSATARSPS